MQDVLPPLEMAKHSAAKIVSWVHKSPDFREYIDHVENGIPLRKIAKRDGIHPSTVLRRVRKIEARRDDPIFDEILTCVSRQIQRNQPPKEALMNTLTNDQKHEPETKDMVCILRRLSEQTAFMVMSLDLSKAVVMRGVGKALVRSAVLSRELGQHLLIKDWVERTAGGKFNRYEITNAGRAGLKRLVAELATLNKNSGFAECASPFQEQHREWGERAIRSPGGSSRVRMRVNLRESPINSLGRKKDKNGRPFLSQELLQASDRLREDFELAQLGPRVTQNWEYPS